jgi:hypothetical protein
MKFQKHLNPKFQLSKMKFQNSRWLKIFKVPEFQLSSPNGLAV